MTTAGLLTVLGFVFFLRFAQDLFVPTVLSVLIAYALNPAVTAITWLRMPRVIAAASVVVALFAVTGFGVYSLRTQAVAAIASLPDAVQKVLTQLQRPKGPTGAIAKIQEAAKELEKTAADAASEAREPSRGITKVQIEEPVFRANDYLWYGSMSFLGLLSQTVMMSFLVFFLLASGDLFKRKLVKIVGTNLAEKRITVEAINEINGQIERFLLIQILTGALVGICTAGALWALGVNQPLFWGLAAGVLNSIPYFGALLVSGGLALVAFLQFGTVLMTIEVAGTALLITSLEGFLLTPALMGKTAGINGVAMFLSLLFWSWMWGVIGTIVAVPIMMVIKSVCDRIEDLKPVGELLGER
jgi:predicted PurR-regulated permease PerM